MSKIITFVTGLVDPVLSYLYHLAAVAVIALAAKHGFHISIPVWWTSLGTYTGLAFLRLILKNISKSIHSGKLEAQIEAAGAQALHTVVQDILNDAK